MATVILAQDVASLGLLFAEGRLDTPLGEIITAVETWQREQGRRIGETPEDFLEVLIFLLLFEPGDPKIPVAKSLQDSYQAMRALPLQAMLPKLLSYDHVYCNDEGSHWTRLASPADGIHEQELFEVCYGGDEAAYREKRRLREHMRPFFATDIKPPNPKEVQTFLTVHGISETLLWERSRPCNAARR